MERVASALAGYVAVTFSTIFGGTSMLPNNTVSVQSGPRTAGTSETCEYLGCKDRGAGELRGHYYRQNNEGIPWTMCAEHIKPEAHPMDLHEKLLRWENVA